jgi:CrcB protein
LTVLFVALAGAIGAPARYVLDAWLDDRLEATFPWGTFVVNVVGSVLFGVLVGLQHSGVLATRSIAVWGTGFCGTFTTFSTHAVESLWLVEDGARRLAAYNVLGTLVTCVGGAAAGLGIAQAF